MIIYCSKEDSCIKKQIENFMDWVCLDIDKNIYIISDYYNNVTDAMLVNSILVLKDGWKVENVEGISVGYNEDEKIFLMELGKVLGVDEDIIRIYLGLTKLSDINKDSNTFKYFSIYYKYLTNLERKTEGKIYKYNTDELLEELELLGNGEKVTLLKAKIHLDLRDEWRLAYDILLDCTSSESKLMRGRIMLYKYTRFEAALEIFKKIRDNEYAKYELGVCYQRLGYYQKAIEMYKEAIGELEDKAYLDKAYDNLIFIYKELLHDVITANMYGELKSNDL